MPLIIFAALLILCGLDVQASSTRTIDADIIRSSDASKTFTLPSVTATIVGRSTTDTLTNKTIDFSQNTILNDPALKTWVQEIPSGSINGSNTAFTLSQSPTSSSGVHVFLNGLAQIQGVGKDYTISGSTITFVTAPETAQTLTVIYQY